MILWFAGSSAVAGLLHAGAALPAAIRHGARVGAGQPAAGGDHHRDRHRHHAWCLARASRRRAARMRRASWCSWCPVRWRLRSSTWRANERLGAVPASIAAVFVYTTFTNMFERPEGIKIASDLHRRDRLHVARRRATLRSTELRVHGFELDDMARAFINGVARRGRAIRIIANRPGTGLPSDARTSCARPTSRTTHAAMSRCCFSRFSRAMHRSSATCCACRASRWAVT